MVFADVKPNVSFPGQRTGSREERGGGMVVIHEAACHPFSGGMFGVRETRHYIIVLRGGSLGMRKCVTGSPDSERQDKDEAGRHGIPAIRGAGY